MEYKHFKNSDTHCVQACLQTLLHYFGMPVLSIGKLDKIARHKDGMFTWMSRYLLWLSNRFDIIHVENLDYRAFAKGGKKYLEEIWDADTFKVQDQFSDLVSVQKDAKLLVHNKNIILQNRRYGVEDIKFFSKRKYFILLSVNQNILYGGGGYGAHMVVVAGFNEGGVTLIDPDRGITSYTEKRLADATYSTNKPDFSMTLLKVR